MLRELWRPRQSASWKRADGRGLAVGPFPLPPPMTSRDQSEEARRRFHSKKPAAAAAASLSGMAESGVQVGAGAGKGAGGFRGAGLQGSSSPAAFAAGAAGVALPAVEAAAAQLLGGSQTGRLTGEGDACLADFRVGARNEAARRLLFPGSSGESVKRAPYPLSWLTVQGGGGLKVLRTRNPGHLTCFGSFWPLCGFLLPSQAVL